MLRLVHKGVRRPCVSALLSTNGRKCKDAEDKPVQRDLLKRLSKVCEQVRINKSGYVQNNAQSYDGVEMQVLLEHIKDAPRLRQRVQGTDPLDRRRILPTYKPIELFCDIDGNPKVFSTVEELQAATLSSTAPLNQIEEWIQWTQEGKLWRFPIDNEQDWEGELSTPFHDHIFFEQPNNSVTKSVPVATFLELVSIGLAQNPYFSVDEKRKHIEWYSNYFKDKVEEINMSVQEEIRLNKLEEEARKLSKP